MSWLTPSLIAALVGTAVLVFTYFYLYLEDKKRYLAIWTAAWGFNFIRYLFMLLIVTGGKTPFLLIGNQLAGLISGLLLLAGGYRFINRSLPPFMIPVFISGAGWIVFSSMMNFSFLITSLPTFTLLGAIYIWVGILFFKSSLTQKKERTVVGAAFIIWGIHKMDYPFLRPVTWFAPWGYLLAAALEMITAIGIIVVYFKKTKDELSDSEKQLQSIYNTSDNIAFIVTNLAGENTKIMDINPGGENIFKCKASDVIGRRTEIFHPKESARRIPERQAELLKGKVYASETVLVRKNGESFPALYTLHPRFDSEGQLIGTLEVVIDISQRLLIEDEMRLQGEIIQRMSEGVYLVKRDGIIIYANPRMEKMLGYNSGEILGKYATITLKSPRKTMEPIVAHLDADGFWQGEMENKRKDGSVFWRFASVASFHHSRHGEVVVGVHLDITEEKQARKEKETLESQLMHAHKMEAVGTLSGGIAHEFNNILGIILGNAELAMEDTPADHPVHEFAKEIKTASLRGKKIVSQLLSFSRKDSKKMQVLDIRQTLEEAVSFLRSSIPSNIEFNIYITPDCGQIHANRNQIHQVMINLCSNAAHAMEKNGGMLSITAENKTVREKIISLDHSIEPGGYVLLKISDTGHGIPADIIEHIFDPFFTTKAVGEGSGMGLAVVHGILKSHGGIIRVQSRESKGTTFECYLPVHVEEELLEEIPEESLEKGSETILFVDDEIQLVDAGQRILEKLGYRVFSYTNPLTALDFLKSSHREIDLVVTDMTMPQMTGDKLLKAIQKVHPGIKSIICTGYSSRMDKQKAKDLGAGGYIMKPMGSAALSKAVRETLDS